MNDSPALPNGPPAAPWRWRSAFDVLGALWFAAVLLVLLLVALASATVYESTHGTERAAAAFYGARWFAALLALLGVNVLASLLARWPFSRRLTGFVITHTSILVILLGAWMSNCFGVYGQIALAEGQSADSFTIPLPTLACADLAQRSAAVVELPPSAFDGFGELHNPPAPELALGGLRLEVLRYLPHCNWQWRVLDDLPERRAAVQVALTTAGREEAVWLFAGDTGQLGAVLVAFQEVNAEDDLRRLLAQAADPPPSVGTVELELAGEAFSFPLEACTAQAVDLGSTGCTVQVLRYLPHAQVGADGKELVNASAEPLNPAVEVRVTGPQGEEIRRAFANFPEFQSMHAQPRIEGLKLKFLASGAKPGTDATLRVFALRGGGVWAWFRPLPDAPISREITVGESVDTPWTDTRLTVQRRLEHARVDWFADPVAPPQVGRVPALQLRLAAPGGTSEVWVRKFEPRRVPLAGTTYELAFANKIVPLGFGITLDRFRMQKYPGEDRPRTFESFITMRDAATTSPVAGHISMNSPVGHGRYNLYQSSYSQDRGAATSVLSVARDPGTAVVFTGYVTLVIGMLTVLGTRVAEQRQAQRIVAASRVESPR